MTLSDKYHVVLADLQEMASTFSREADRYDDLLPTLVPPEADSGDSRLNGTMRGVMASLKVLHGKLATQIENHAGKLREAHDSYQRNDSDAKDLFDELNPKTWG